jgi:peptidoglycan/LPS O-acetylase OafA/YrhL
VLLVPTAFGFGQLDGGFAWSNFIAGFPRVTFGFFTGVWLYLVRAHERVPALPAWAAYLALAAVFMIPGEGVWRAIVDLAAALVIFPMLVATSANANAGGWMLRASTFVGMVSYGVYILHVPLWGWLSLAMDRFDLVMPGVVNVLIVAALTMAAAAVLHFVYDKPLRRRLSGKSRLSAVSGGD